MAELINTSGKRKTAVARASVKNGSGKVRVNSVPVEILTPELAKLKIMEPLQLAPERAAKVDIDVSVSGGGVIGQAEAVRTAIAKGLVEYFKDEELERTFKQIDRTLVVSDPRRKLPKKPLGRGARKKRQKSYR
ncbi:MAG TPA: 30S ribosomal protein S9 [Methanomassiliicoccales archaeon]|nr:30S ribosomal protein S9 [Methanomassiliicoccales archaeon]HXZ23107.1 30S ribosomal protein S9 [Methanomassiliicoccales archaeon]